ncbi:MAG TPA: lytic murein transglycosylase B [Pseudomonadales bacterium]|jgi:membrane-bound lytic murein transglycosylase B|nr:lytic murein transglycosylase B [Cellvibrionales bacterium]HRG50572.1 lytic murein transglycosylase B [Pseudomonadales bacterium]
MKTILARMVTLSRFCTVVLFGSLLAASNVYAGEYEQRSDVQAFADEMQTRYNFKKEDALEILSHAEKKQAILDAIARPAEKAKPWKDYRKIFLTDARVDGGVNFWLAHEQTLQAVSSSLQVEPEMIVAIIGIETSYGKNTGSYRVIDALATLAFDYPPRSAFFRQELQNFLLLAREQKKDPLILKGSYAGAMGYGQFMPSSYRNYAADFDKDGFADIWGNTADAIASVANYFKKHGWQAGEPVLARANTIAGFDTSLLATTGGFKPKLSLQEIAERGASPVVGGLGNARKAVLISQEGDYGTEYWLGFDNFYTITRYNNSSMYAMAAFQLADVIKAEHASRKKQAAAAL